MFTVRDFTKSDSLPWKLMPLFGGEVMLYSLGTLENMVCVKKQRIYKEKSKSKQNAYLVK